MAVKDVIKLAYRRGHRYANMHDLDGPQDHLSLLFALRYPHQDCLQCLGIKSSMRECLKSEYKNRKFPTAVPLNRRQSGYAVAVVTRVGIR